jgi:CHAT domain-containing protein
VTANVEALCRDAQVHLERLYELLVRPLSPLEVGEPGATTPRLYISAPAFLNGVPFAALFDGVRYLLERYRTVHLAGGLAATDFKPDVSALLSLGFSNGGRLPFAVSEAEQIAESFDCDEVRRVWLLTEEAATQDDFSDYSQEASLIHLATHAAFRADNPFFSWLRLADTHLSVADLCDLEFKHYPQVTLSACETALSGQRGGGFVSPVWALMAAGAGAVIASVWKVHDASTADLMAHFYEHLMAGLPADAALRTAQLKIKEQKPHPLYWAGFTLVQRGDLITKPI